MDAIIKHYFAAIPSLSGPMHRFSINEQTDVFTSVKYAQNVQIFRCNITAICNELRPQFYVRV